MEMEEDCPRSGASMYSGVRIANAKNIRVHMCYRVHYAGTRVPGAENVGEHCG